MTVTLLRLHAHDYRSHCRASASIGAGIPGMKLVLQNGTHADEGEIVILGPQLAVGYWQSDELTGKAFREVELDGRRQRGYFTGDWGQREGENIYFVGRIDNLRYLFAAVFDAARWPASVYRGVVAFVFTFVIPLTVMTSVPADALLGVLSMQTLVSALIGTAAFAGLARWVFVRSLARYTSASS